VLKEYLSFFDKVDKRVRDERVTELLSKLDLAKHTDFEGDKKTPPKKLEKLEKQLKGMAKDRDRGFKNVELRFDDEHNLWEAVFVSSQGAEHVINWELASSPECRQMIAKFKQIEPYMEPPFMVEPKQGGKKTTATLPPVEEEEQEDLTEFTEKDLLKTAEDAFKSVSPREIFEYVLGEGKRGFIIQRYKGLGEMTAPQLWETTMDPERRTLLSVKLEDIAECETIFTTLMGEDVDARRKFIEENALDVKNLDI
jgi:DNA gyrase subunit B